MIGDEIGPVNTDLVVVPAYGTPEAVIVQPERHAPLSLYAVRRWLPRLGAQRLALVLVLRTLAFDAPSASDGTRRITVSREALAEATGVANAGTVGEWLRSEPIVGGGGWRRLARSCPEAEALARFVPRLRYAYSGKVRTGLIVCIRMDDPLAPEDEAAVERIRVGQQTAAASQLAFTGLPAARTTDLKTAFPASATSPVGENLTARTVGKDDIQSSARPRANASASDDGLKMDDRLSPAASKATDQVSVAAVKAAALTSVTSDGQQAPAAGPLGGLKAAYPPVNVNDNGSTVPSSVEVPFTETGDAVLARAVRGMVPGLGDARELRRALSPLVSITGQYLGDAGSDAFYAKAYLALYRAGRLDLAVEAMRSALDSAVERPGAVFTAALKALCSQEGIALGLKPHGAPGSGESAGRLPVADEGGDDEGRLPAAGGASGDTGGADAGLWQQARAELEASMAHSTYDTWLRNCELVAVRWQEPVVVVLAFPHQTAREWVAHRLRLTVERALSRVTGRETVLECVTAGDAGRA